MCISASKNAFHLIYISIYLLHHIRYYTQINIKTFYLFSYTFCTCILFFKRSLILYIINLSDDIIIHFDDAVQHHIDFCSLATCELQQNALNINKVKIANNYKPLFHKNVMKNSTTVHIPILICLISANFNQTCKKHKVLEIDFC